MIALTLHCYRFMPGFVAVGVAVGILLLGGCNRGPKQYTISGDVTYRGQPVAEGEIVFADGKGADPTAVGKIENGRYQIQTLAGEKRIRVTASKETGKVIDGPMGVKYPERVDLIPPKYNTATTLVRTIAPDGVLVLDFRLE